MRLDRRDLLMWLGAGLAGAGGVGTGSAKAAPESLPNSPPARLPEPIAVRLPPLPKGWQVVDYAVLAGGDLAIAGTDVDLRSEWRRDGDGALLGHPLDKAATAQAGIWVFDGTRLVAGPRFPLLDPWPVFDRFADGRWLVASARSLGEPNARILTARGRELGRIRLGDGLQHLKIDDRDRIWVGWFDEGVFGNDGWEVAGETRPPSSFGLAAFDSTGAVLVHAGEAPGGSTIADCYALNVVGDTAWACAYTDFPILACGPNGGSRWWPTTLSGPKALAVRPPYVLAAGGYGEDGNRLVLVKLDGGRGTTLRQWRLPFDFRADSERGHMDARSDLLHVVRNGTWLRWELRSFLSEARET